LMKSTWMVFCTTKPSSSGVFTTWPIATLSRPVSPHWAMPS
jgi:hypothetical protein